MVQCVQWSKAKNGYWMHCGPAKINPYEWVVDSKQWWCRHHDTMLDNGNLFIGSKLKENIDIVVFWISIQGLLYYINYILRTDLLFLSCPTVPKILHYHFHVLIYKIKIWFYKCNEIHRIVEMFKIKYLNSK